MSQQEELSHLEEQIKDKVLCLNSAKAYVDYLEDEVVRLQIRLRDLIDDIFELEWVRKDYLSWPISTLEEKAPSDPKAQAALILLGAEVPDDNPC